MVDALTFVNVPGSHKLHPVASEVLPNEPVEHARHADAFSAAE
jgi:hypothetical protein